MAGLSGACGAVKGSHPSSVRAELVRSSPATRKRALKHRFMVLKSPAWPESSFYASSWDRPCLPDLCQTPPPLVVTEDKSIRFPHHADPVKHKTAQITGVCWLLPEQGTTQRSSLQERHQPEETPRRD